jgi:hypothetical protein
MRRSPVSSYQLRLCFDFIGARPRVALDPKTVAPRARPECAWT